MVGFSLKDHLFNRAKVEYLAGLLAVREGQFPKQRFVKAVMENLEALELKQRITWIAQNLEQYLPRSYDAAVALILRSLPPPLDENKTDNDFGDFIFAPFGEFVVRNGLRTEHLELSLQTLKELTKRFSMEDSIRYFIREFPEETMARLELWARDSNYHVRRLVSESTRPLLPWSGRIDLQSTDTLPLLDYLHADITRYVTRSVANHLNDIAKSQPELVVRTLRTWHDLDRQEPKELQWMTRHALRTLVKQGHQEALALLGFDSDPLITCGDVNILQALLKRGQTLEFSFELVAHRDESIVVDYVIDFVKAGGKRSTKVYKAANLNLKRGETRKIDKRHKLHANATTYQLYPGEHFLTIQINGKAVASKPFVLT